LAAGGSDIVVADPLEQEIERLYQANYAGLCRFASIAAGSEETGHDAVQESFLRYFAARRAGLHIQRPRAWLFRAARNFVMDQHKSALARNEVSGQAALDSMDRRGTAARTSSTLDWIWEVLTPRETECVRLRAQGLSHDEVADVLQIRPGTVTALLARAQGKVRAAWVQREEKGRRFAAPAEDCLAP
jgi:RNA polymerase sigma-70 factor (ECF subfamily)